ncbi:MAG: hypothetical protein HY744_18935, partial [Deltaproteobacteria bacterium]|nr:hypothetical protein [Deltaproteobacteria bacterium]
MVDGTAGQDGSGGARCERPADCPLAPACQRAVCEDGRCGLAAEDEGATCHEAGGKLCDGHGHCVECTQDGQCAAESACDEATGSCVPPPCGNGTLDGAETDVDCGGPACEPCATGKSCKSDGDCGSDFCPAGICVDKKPDGEPCSGANECLAGHCVDHVCCDAPCDGTCEACLAAKTDGVDGECSLVPAGTDPNGSCGLAELCGGAGACANVHAWSKSFGGSSVAHAMSIAVDATGNVLLTGRALGPTDFGGGPLGFAGGFDVYVAKLAPGGDHLWSKRFGGPALDDGFGVAADADGNVLLTGTFMGTVDFGGGPLVSADSFDAFVLKFDSNGNHVWSKRFGGPNWDWGTALGVDGTGNVLLTGAFQGAIDFGGGPLAAAGDWDIFVAKLDPNGNHVWSKRFGGPAFDMPRSISLDAGGNLLLAGEFEKALDFGGGPLLSAGDRDVFVAKLDPNGNHVWSKRFGGSGSDGAESVATDLAGNVLLPGAFPGAVDFGGGPLGSAGGCDVFVAKLDPNGNHV